MSPDGNRTLVEKREAARPALQMRNTGEMRLDMRFGARFSDPVINARPSQMVQNFSTRAPSVTASLWRGLPRTSVTFQRTRAEIADKTGRMCTPDVL